MSLDLKTVTNLGSATGASSLLMAAPRHISLGFGLIGTIFGIYNIVRIKKLEHRVTTMEQEHQLDNDKA